MQEWVPTNEVDLLSAISDAISEGRRLEIRGGGTHAEVGLPDRQAQVLSLRAFDGIIDYDPGELVMTAHAGTPLETLSAALVERGQCFPFEPWGDPRTTIGGIVAAGVSGSRRVSAGATRDYLLGFRAASGRGEMFVAGAKVVKNVTGYDLPKLMCNSWGRLAAMTEVTFKVLPSAPVSRTLVWMGLDTRSAWALMSNAMRLPADVAAAAHTPEYPDMAARTMVRLDGFGPSVVARMALLRSAMAGKGEAAEWQGEEARAAWELVRGGSSLPIDLPLWRLSVSARRAMAMTHALNALGGRWVADWAGALVWLAFDGDVAQVRRLAEEAGGHATLMRAPLAMRTQVPAFHPEPAGVAALTGRVRRAFDPSGVFETGRFLDHIDAN